MPFYIQNFDVELEMRVNVSVQLSDCYVWHAHRGKVLRMHKMIGIIIGAKTLCK